MTKIKNISGIIPKKSSVLGKLPEASQLETGEIAVNINSSDPFISVKDNEGNVQRLGGSGGMEVVSALPASGDASTIYALETEIVDPTGGTSYYYDLYIYETGSWRKIGETTVPLQAGENITIENNRINADVVVSLTQNDYDTLVSTSAVVPSTIYNITDKPILNVNEYQKKLVIGDGLSLDSVTNVLDCTLDPDLYVMVASLPISGVANKIYLVKEVDPLDSTVNFMQYGWINDAWVEYGKTSNLQPNIAGSGITIGENNDINTKLGAGLSYDGNSAITASVGSGIKLDTNNAIAANYAAPLALNGSNQLTVSSSSTYNSTGTELFTRAGAYSMYDTIGKAGTISLTINTGICNSYDYAECYQLDLKGKLFEFAFMLRLKATTANSYVQPVNVKINGKNPARIYAVSACNYEQLYPCGAALDGDGKIWMACGANGGNNDRYYFTGIMRVE